MTDVQDHPFMTTTTEIPKVPLAINPIVFDRDVYEPISSLASYVLALFDGGFTPETLRDDFSDLYHLDFYQAQVDNGGHSQFIGNSARFLESNMDRALRGARMLGLDGTVAQLEACAAWCRDNPKEAAKQDGFEHCASALNALDRTHDPIFDEDGLLTFLQTLPNDLATKLQGMLYLPENTDALIDSYMHKVMQLSETLVPSAAAAKASHILDPLIEWKATIQCGETPSDSRTDTIATLKQWLGQYLDDRVDSLSSAQLRDAFLERIHTRLTNHGRMKRSKYLITTYVWIWQHPDLLLLKDVTREEHVAQLCATTLSTTTELDRRDLVGLRNTLPKTDPLHLSILLGQVFKPTQVEEFQRTFTKDQYEGQDGTSYRRIQVGPYHFYLGVKGSYAALHALRPTQKRKFFGLIKTNDTDQNATSQAGEVLADIQVSDQRRDLFDTLFVPEAFALWWPKPHGEKQDTRFLSKRSAALVQGIPAVFDQDKKHIIWQMVRDDKIVVLEATRDLVSISSGLLKATLTVDELKKYRQKCS